eukprot:CAMPEP_0176497106 /NCGR_PEP_ID=MMETSP0200_2-20121128/11543_1 /TAXON_ID=947934 /ORGANISM="Chaetoceros sp., Strain GSL56" /LENGTH=242 /DNA_ID=CAMNT_0017895089 /DNA_START=150 /DNA_END=878 /DNA_ORIENTATION=-
MAFTINTSISSSKTQPQRNLPLLFATNNDNDNNSQLLISMELPKPLGLVLEEVQENQPMGVKVQQLSQEGSAYASEYRDTLVGLKISQVMDADVSNMSFDNVMECIIQAPSPMKISFVPLVKEGEDKDSSNSAILFQPGTMVEIRVLQNDQKQQERVIQAKVGDNLRKVLLDNQVELYKGLKKKLGNCGGGGQCTFCAVDFVQEEGWSERSEYENKKIAKMPKTARLACLNNIQGPATIRVE